LTFNKDLLQSFATPGVSILEVRRQYCLEDVLHNTDSKFFTWSNQVEVQFFNEDGVDAGGLKRSLITTLLNQINENDTFLRGENRKILMDEFEAQELNLHSKFAIVVAFLAIHTNHQLALFDKPYFRHIISGKPLEITESDDLNGLRQMKKMLLNKLLKQMSGKEMAMC
jgi:hypothetical protein